MNNSTSTNAMRAKDDLKSAASHAGAAARDAASEAKTKGEELLDKGKDMASEAVDKAKGMAANVASKASDLAATATNKADDAAAAVGGGMKSMAHSIKDNLPREGMIGSASSAVARSLESSARYLEEEGVSGMAEDLTNLIRRNPIPALFIGIGIGFLVARSLRS